MSRCPRRYPLNRGSKLDVRRTTMVFHLKSFVYKESVLTQVSVKTHSKTRKYKSQTTAYVSKSVLAKDGNPNNYFLLLSKPVYQGFRLNLGYSRRIIIFSVTFHDS